MGRRGSRLVKGDDGERGGWGKEERKDDGDSEKEKGKGSDTMLS
jgi:hypothetical protein